MLGIGIALAILVGVCFYAALSSRRAGCDRRDSLVMAGIGGPLRWREPPFPHMRSFSGSR